MSTTYLTSPNTQVNGVYTGVAYVLDSIGGFSIDQSFPQVQLNTHLPILQYNISEALQIRYNVRTMNEKIGVIKDQNNDKVLEVIYYDAINQNLIDDYGDIKDSVTVSSLDFLHNLTTDNIISMGKMSSLYSDFNYTVMQYFGAPAGFTSVFQNVGQFSANQGIFDASAFISLVNSITFDGVTGSIISPLQGYFTVKNLNSHLRFICGSNIFGNRKPSGYNGSNFTVFNGFMPGDLIYIPNGISITLNIGIEPELYMPISNKGPLNLRSIDSMVNYSKPQTNIHKVTTSSITDIKQTYSVPILIILENLDTFSFTNFGNNWTTPIQQPPSQYIPDLTKQKWMCVSMSSLGQYQNVAEAGGSVYVTNDYGATWGHAVNIGVSDKQTNTNNTMSIGSSETGLYQTVSNGLSIFISSDYGVNWRKTFSFGLSDVYVSVSLCGKYQSVLSCGDSIYTSNDYGVTWTRYNDTESSLYNAIATFPAGAISMSFTGQYQTIASESLYVSTDYGETWTDAFGEFSDFNWQCVSISSDGLHQTAVESTGDIYISNDYGVTWNPVLSDLVTDKQWTSVSISANGNYQTAIEYDGTIYLSSDYGVTWKQSTDSRLQNKKWIAVAISANGQYQTVVEYGGGIYISSLV
jgi:photosystem II stability/assembly factor-like uncharacterized protein